MSLTEKIGKGIQIAAVVCGLASAGTGFYFLNKYHTYRETSPEYKQIADVEREASKLKDLVFKCVPETYDALILKECVDKKAKYKSLEWKQYNLERRASLSEEGKKMLDYYRLYSPGFLLGGVLGSLLLYSMGQEVADFGRRRREEEE